MLNQIDRGLTVKGAKMTLQEYLEEWLTEKEQSLESETFHCYSRYCRIDIVPILGNIKLKDISIRNINDLYAQLFDKGKGLPTLKYIHRVLHSALNDACVKRYLTYNPSTKPKLPNPKSHQVLKMMSLKEMAKKNKSDSNSDWYYEDYADKEMKVWTEDEISQFLITALGSSHYCLYDLETEKTGLRAGELLGLFIRDVEFEERYALIKVRRQLKKVKGIGWVFISPKTQSGIRTLQVKKHRSSISTGASSKSRNNDESVSKRWKDNGLLFPTKYGTPMD